MVVKENSKRNSKDLSGRLFDSSSLLVPWRCTCRRYTTKRRWAEIEFVIPADVARGNSRGLGDTWEITVTSSMYFFRFDRFANFWCLVASHLLRLRRPSCSSTFASLHRGHTKLVDTISGSTEFPTSNRIAVDGTRGRVNDNGYR